MRGPDSFFVGVLRPALGLAMLLLLIVGAAPGCKSTTAESTLQQAATSGATQQARPIILIHGSGDQQQAVQAVRSFGINLRAQGYKGDIHNSIRYDWRQPHVAIRKTVAQQMRDIFNQYEPNQKFIVAGHSLGGFLTVYVPVTANLTSENNQIRISSRVAMMIELAGTSKGMIEGEQQAPIITRYLRNRSETIDSLYDQSGFMRKFHREYARMIATIPHCSIVSPYDVLVPNPSSSRYDHSKQVQILKTPPRKRILRPIVNRTLTHYQVAEHPDAAQAALEHCLNLEKE